MRGWIILLFIYLFFRIKNVDSGGKIYVQLIKYKNPSNKQYDGDCCNRCRGNACDNRVNFCLSDKNEPSKCFNSRKTSLKIINDDFEFPRINVFPGERGADFNMTFDRKLPKILRLRITIYNEDTTKKLVADFQKDCDLQEVFNISGQQFDLVENSQNNNEAERKYLSFNIRASCNRGFIGRQCDVIECKPRDDFTGHYTCTSDNKIKCLPGWKNELQNCTDPITPPILTTSIKLRTSSKSSSTVISKIMTSSTVTFPHSTFIKISSYHWTTLTLESIQQTSTIIQSFKTSSTHCESTTTTQIERSKGGSSIHNTNNFTSSLVIPTGTSTILLRPSSECVETTSLSMLISTSTSEINIKPSSKCSHTASTLIQTRVTSSITTTKQPSKTNIQSNAVITKATLGAGAVIFVSLVMVLLLYFRKRWRRMRKVSAYDEGVEATSTNSRTSPNHCEKPFELTQNKEFLAQNQLHSSSTSQLIPTESIESHGNQGDKT